MGTFPFAGGTYGFARVTLNPYIGFMVGCFEAIQNILYVSAAVIPIGMMITYIFDGPSSIEPLYWFLFHVVALCFHVYGGNVFWVTNAVLGVVTLLLIIVYILGTSKQMDFYEYVTEDPISRSQPHSRIMLLSDTLSVLPLTTWMFAGVEMITQAGDEVKEVSSILYESALQCTSHTMQAMQRSCRSILPLK